MTAIEQVYLARQSFFMYSQDADFGVAMDGPGASNYFGSFSGSQATVQHGFTGFLGYFAQVLLVEFDTRAIGAATSAKLEMAFEGTIRESGDELRVYAYDFGDAEEADWVDDYSMLTLVARMVVPVANEDYEELEDVDLLANVTFGGYTRFVVVLNGTADQDEPAEVHQYGLNLGWGNDDKENPSRPGIRLTLGYDGVAVNVAGSQGALAGDLADITEFDPKPLGLQGAPAGRLFASALPVRGLQGVARGVLRVVGIDYASGGEMDTLRLGTTFEDEVGYFSSDADYADARAGTGVTLQEQDQVGQTLIALLTVGQHTPGDGSAFFCYQVQFSLNTGLLPAAADLVTAEFRTWGAASYTGEADVLELRVATIGAWIPGASVEGSTILVGTAPIEASAGVGAWTIDREALFAAINRTGTTGFLIVSRRFVDGSAPAVGVDDSQVIRGAGNPSAQALELTIGYTGKRLRGVQGRPSATLADRQVAVSVAGVQGEPTGEVFLFPPVTLGGVQGEPSGVVGVRAAYERLRLAVGRARAFVMGAGRSRVRR